MLHPQLASKIGITPDRLKHIKNIVFDLGGVIIDIDPTATVTAFKNLGIDSFSAIYTLVKQTPVFDMLETGKIPTQAFRNELKKYCANLTDDQIDNAWNMMIGNMPSANLPLLRSVRKQYRTFLLSNTNAIHIQHFLNYLEQKFGYNALNDMFEKSYFSHEIGQRKPDREAFEYVLSDAGLIASETLFIDDLQANIEGAKKAGLLTYHLENESIQDLFASL
jgi:glucose-1-phosphatase